MNRTEQETLDEEINNTIERQEQPKEELQQEERKRLPQQQYQQRQPPRPRGPPLRTFIIEVGGEDVAEKIVVEAQHIMEALAKFNQMYWDACRNFDILGITLEEIEHIR